MYRPTIDIEEKFHTFHTIQCNGIISHGPKIGRLWVYYDHRHKNNHKTSASMSFVCHAAILHMFVFTLSRYR